ncbi:hypothetical protein Tco_0433343 [Tanacetum coccineum]
MCCQLLPPPLSSPSAKLMIMALEDYGYKAEEEYGYQRNGGLHIPMTSFFLKRIESYELMIDLQSIRDPESINFR